MMTLHTVMTAAAVGNPGHADQGLNTGPPKAIICQASTANLWEPIMDRPRYTKEEHARRARELYERDIKPRLSDQDIGKVLALDVDSGEFVLGDHVLDVCDELYAIRPQAQPFVFRIGYAGVHRFGPRLVEK